MIDWLQWPAMVATLAAAWLVASTRRPRRLWGFAIFVLSNVLWVVWAVPAGAYALIVLQLGLFVLNLRGIRNNEKSAEVVAGQPSVTSFDHPGGLRGARNR